MSDRPIEDVYAALAARLWPITHLGNDRCANCGNKLGAYWKGFACEGPGICCTKEKCSRPNIRRAHEFLASWSGVGLVVEAMQERGCGSNIETMSGNRWYACFNYSKQYDKHTDEIATVPWEAVARAALAALEGEKQ